jgi:hypothetical protein
LFLRLTPLVPNDEREEQQENETQIVEEQIALDRKTITDWKARLTHDHTAEVDDLIADWDLEVADLLELDFDIMLD